jgi:hypothetical protein
MGAVSIQKGGQKRAQKSLMNGNRNPKESGYMISHGSGKGRGHQADIASNTSDRGESTPVACIARDGNRKQTQESITKGNDPMDPKAAKSTKTQKNKSQPTDRRRKNTRTLNRGRAREPQAAPAAPQSERATTSRSSTHNSDSLHDSLSVPGGH